MKTTYITKEDDSHRYPIRKWEDLKRNMEEIECLHLGCPECHGTGRKENGQPCIHWISCPCPRCNPRY